MGKLVAILGSSGDGKTTSTIINPDGSYKPNDYQGMNTESHFIINLDRKVLPFPGGMWEEQKKNYLEPVDFAGIRNTLSWIAGQKHIKSVSIDTINIYLSMKEYNDRKKMTFDQWRDIANDVIELNRMCNTILRDDQIAYIFGHPMLQDQPDGTQKVVYGDSGNNEYWFQTKANHSSAKTPLGMFDKFEIPNSLSLVDKTIREYYKMEPNIYGQK